MQEVRMLTGANGYSTLEPDRDDDRPVTVPSLADLAGRPKLGSPEQFAGVMDWLVASAAPRLFAVVEELGDRVDARIAAWGLAWDDSAEIISVDGGIRMAVPTAEHALRGFGFGDCVTAHLVWVRRDIPAAPSVLDIVQFPGEAAQT